MFLTEGDKRAQRLSFDRRNQIERSLTFVSFRLKKSPHFCVTSHLFPFCTSANGQN